MKKLLTEWRKHLSEEVGERTFTAYHGSNVPIKDFDPDQGAQGVMWFSEDKDKIKRGESGANSSKYIMTVELTVRNPAGWDDYDNKYLQQIKEEGFDSIQLDDDWIIFETSSIRVTGTEEIDNIVDEEVELYLKEKKDGKGASSKGYSLRDWFKGGGWKQTGGKYDGKPCAKQPGQKTKPYCRDADDRAKLSKKEKDKRAAKKRKEDPNPNRSGKAKNVRQKK